jgi:hypothetical protein
LLYPQIYLYFVCCLVTAERKYSLALSSDFPYVISRVQQKTYFL